MVNTTSTLGSFKFNLAGAQENISRILGTIKFNMAGIHYSFFSFFEKKKRE